MFEKNKLYIFSAKKYDGKVTEWAKTYDGEPVFPISSEYGIIRFIGAKVPFKWCEERVSKNV